MKKLCTIGILLFTVVCFYGQTTDMSKRFEEFKKQQNQRFDTFKVSQQAKFDAFRKEQNEKYAEFMKNSWEMFDALPPVVPEEEKKVEPVVYVEPNQARTTSNQSIGLWLSMVGTVASAATVVVSVLSISKEE